MKKGGFWRRILDLDPIEPAVLHQARRSEPPPGHYTVTTSTAMGDVHTPWEGTSREDVIKTYLVYLLDPRMDEDGLPPGWRMGVGNFKGQHNVFAYRNDWVGMITVTGGDEK